MNLVIGIYSGYGPHMIHRKGGLYFFLSSLRKVNTNCKVVILCRTVDLYPELIQLCNYMNAEIVPCIPNDLNQIHLFQRYRFKEMHTFLIDKKKTGEVFEKVLMSDLADVIFQEDPFHFEIPDGIYPAAEQSILSEENNSSSQMNMSWIQEYSFLEIEPTRFHNKYVICCGTIIGYYDAILEYLEFYNRINEDLKNDQAVINIYVHHYKSEKIKVEKYTDSKILTLDNLPYMIQLVENM